MIKRFLTLSALACALGAIAFSGSEVAKTARPKGSVTFADQIAPIVFNNCTSCHRPGEAAPFALMSYQDVKKRGALIAAVTQTRYMPPWHATPGYGDFIDMHRLTDEQIATVKQWVDEGMPEGNPANLPALPKFPEGLATGEAAGLLVITMREGV